MPSDVSVFPGAEQWLRAMGITWYHPLLYGAISLLVSFVAAQLLDRTNYPRRVRLIAQSLILALLVHSVVLWMQIVRADEHGVQFGPPLACAILECVMALVAWSFFKSAVEWWQV